MSDLMNVPASNDLTMSSREIAELTGKQHVKRNIEKMMTELEVDVSKVGRIYKDSMNHNKLSTCLMKSILSA